MSIRDWSPGRVSLLDHAQEVHIHTSGSQDQRTGDQYAADLAADTDQSLRHSRRWQNSEPLADHRKRCDCPPTAVGCTERRMLRSVADLGSRSGIPAHGGRWATKGAAHDPIALPTPDSNGEPGPVPDPDQPEVPR